MMRNISNSTVVCKSLPQFSDGEVHSNLIDAVTCEVMEFEGQIQSSRNIKCGDIEAVNLDFRNGTICIPLINWDDSVWMRQFHRLRKFRMCAVSLKSLINFPKLKNLEILDLSGNFLENLIGLPSQPKLKSMILFGNKIDTLKNLPDLECLEFLDLSKNRLNNTSSLDVLPIRCPKLKTLYLSKNYLKSLDSLKFIKSMLNLETLYINGNEHQLIEEIEMINSDEIRNYYPPNLKFICLRDGDITEGNEYLYINTDPLGQNDETQEMPYSIKKAKPDLMTLPNESCRTLHEEYAETIVVSPEIFKEPVNHKNQSSNYGISDPKKYMEEKKVIKENPLTVYWSNYMDNIRRKTLDIFPYILNHPFLTR